MTQRPFTMLCIASYFKGENFLRAAKQIGCRVLLLTGKHLEHKAWPRESIDEFFYAPDTNDNWNMDQIISGLTHVLRNEQVDRIVSLDDYDVEKGAHLREHFRIGGMGQTSSRYFRDKLAMRMRAQEAGIPVPAFTSLFNFDKITHFLDTVPAPWLIKPRSQASAAGIKKTHSRDEFWEIIEKLGTERTYYLAERFTPGAVFHVDSLNYNSQTIFARVHQYMNPPMEVAHEGGIFRSHNVEYDSQDDIELQKLNQEVMKAFGMKYSASHTEFIKAKEDGKYYFLETSCRVGGANIADLLEVSSGVNLWSEWAKIERHSADNAYQLPEIQKDYSGIIISLTKQAQPDTSSFDDSEICWRMNMENHIGFIVRSNKLSRVTELLDSYATRIFEEFHAAEPSPDKPSH
ncbi:MAG: ATPase [Bacteroidetes bacterium]|nr:MAG: ATPase [Bacteroidota bacterium]